MLGSSGGGGEGAYTSDDLLFFWQFVSPVRKGKVLFWRGRSLPLPFVPPSFFSLLFAVPRNQELGSSAVSQKGVVVSSFGSTPSAPTTRFLPFLLTKEAESPPKKKPSGFF